MLAEIVRYLDALLRIGEIGDYPNALNGLQLENGGNVTRVAAAVDACGHTLAAAAANGCDLLLVHHGLFWTGVQPVTGGRYRLLKQGLDAGLAVYSAHLPLDAHPTLGNNTLLSRALGLSGGTPFADFHGTAIGLRFQEELAREELARRLERAVSGRVNVIAAGPSLAREIGVITGGAGSQVREMAELGIDTLITGEGPHWTFALAEELGLNVLYGGHYATETFGVRALAADVGARFGLPWEFIDHPSGL